MLRVKPRALKGSAQPTNPSADLFLDQYNEPMGVASLSTAGNYIFGQFEFQMAKPNSRRYHILEDSTYMLYSSSVQNNILNANKFEVNATHVGQRKMKTTHNLGKELYYTSPNASEDNTYPQTGFTPEFILFHFNYVGQPFAFEDRVSTDTICMTARS